MCRKVGLCLLALLLLKVQKEQGTIYSLGLCLRCYLAVSLLHTLNSTAEEMLSGIAF